MANNHLSLTMSTPIKSRMNDIVLMRVFAILGVVAFHVYGMCFDGNHFSDTTRGVFSQIYLVPVKCVLISIAMPLFLAISGYLFFWQLERGKLTSWREMLTKKAQRILAPYFVFSVIMIFTTGRFAELNPWLNIIRGCYWHLWFLPVLMWCFVLGYALRNVMRNKWMCTLILVLFFILTPIEPFLPRILGLLGLTAWFLWFAIGAALQIHKSRIYKVLHYIYTSNPQLS